jgi:tripartite ATP-independent transporter DctM subunit
MSPTLTGCVGIVVLVIAILGGMPIAFAMFIVGFAGFSYLVSLQAALKLLSMEMLNTFSSYSFAVVTCFAVMGALAGYTGASKRLYDFAYKLLGRLPGGLAIATMGACSFFGAICGSASAAAATFGKVALPEMQRHRYSMWLGTGSIAGGATMSILIPPSLVFIIYGIIANQSIGELFIAGIVPGILLAVMFMVQIFLMCLKNPSLGPPGPATSFKEKVKSLPGVIEALALFVVILGGIFLGIFTPTEAGAVGAIGMLAIGLVRKTLTWRGVVASVMDTARLIGMIFMILAGAFIFGRFVAMSKIAAALADMMVSLNWSPTVTFIVFMLPIYIIAGCFIEMLAVVLISVPLFLPLMTRLGFDPIWFGVQIVLLNQIGVLSPPIGMAVYTIKAVAPELPLGVIFRGAAVFIPAMIICAIAVLLFPQIALWLPKAMW